MINIAVVEDEIENVQKIAGFIRYYFQENADKDEYNILKYYDGKDLLKNYNKNIDIIFLDIEMAVVDGMSAAKKIRKANLDVVIIFITKLGNMAIKGYEVDALDFIVKPVEYYAFELRMIKALNYLKKHQKYKLTISPISQGKKVICLSDLYYVEVQGRHLTYHTKDGDFVANGRLYEAEKVLDGDIFVYCNRYCIVNISYVRGFENGFVNVNGALLSVTKGKKEELMSALAKRSVSI